MTLNEMADHVTHRLVGPHSRYSKIGRIRREKLRAEIKAELFNFYHLGCKEVREALAQRQK